MNKPRQYFIETWGCQMNELDSLRLAGQLNRQGLQKTQDAAAADVILLNSCSVREKASQKAYSRLGEYRLLKQKNEDLKIGFCGCVAQQQGDEALKRIKELDFVVGTGRVDELERVLEHCRNTGERIVATGFPEDRQYDMDVIVRDGQYKGMVTIIEGCNKRCTFCIVPTTRGPERCRPMVQILEEVEKLVEKGFCEIELLGQTVNHWREPGADLLDFADLLDRVARVPGVERLRFVTSYPRDFTQDMVDQFATHANLCSYLHLPVQSGSNRVLKTMGRGYEIESYLDLVERLRVARPELALSTDLIVGFPGETAEDFEQTLALVRQVRFSSVFAFCYSPRPGTAAPRLPLPEIEPEIASSRLQELFKTQGEIQKQLNEELVGDCHEVLVTGQGKQPGYWNGRTSCHRIVHFQEPAPQAIKAGSLIDVEITHANAHSLLGRFSPPTS